MHTQWRCQIHFPLALFRSYFCSEISSGFSFSAKKGWCIKPSRALSSIPLLQPGLSHQCPEHHSKMPCVLGTPWPSSIHSFTRASFPVLRGSLPTPECSPQTPPLSWSLPRHKCLSLFQLHCTTFCSYDIFHIWFCFQITFRHIRSILPEDTESVFYLSFPWLCFIHLCI